MSTTQPIKSKDALNQFKNYYLLQKPQPRNYTLIILGLNTALRISDILTLKWNDIYDDHTKTMKKHLEVIEQKTGKSRTIALNRSICTTLKNYLSYSFQEKPYEKEQYLFLSQKGKNEPISRSQAYRIICTAAKASGLDQHISCHSLRKTFGYHAWKQGTPPALLMDLYNHSSYSITKRYLSIEQDERDEVYLKITL
ncbi:MAG: tyrosine-type recombinase/integrase [Lachnospiraceae bacterium]|nr:tyrosine-type recombinase/integrase [Lachnospiraceae bacterium]